MNRSYRILPVYSGDVSGALSALYELGGMSVVHDPSGCNSTYNTHDEIRWYDKESLIFITGLSQSDAVLGNDEFVVDEISDTALKLGPDFTALLSSPVPYLNGTDFRALSMLIEKRTGIPSFFVATNGMHDYVYGAGNAFLAYVKKLGIREKGCLRDSLNLIGATPLDFCAAGSLCEMKEALFTEGIESVYSFAYGEEGYEADRLFSCPGLIVSAAGFLAGAYLNREYGLPMAVGVPAGGFASCIKDALLQGHEGPVLPKVNFEGQKKRLLLIGEPVSMYSLLCAASLAFGVWGRILCPLEIPRELTGLFPDSCLIRTDGEEEIEAAIREILEDDPDTILIGDPFYRRLLSLSCSHVDMPHLAFSGRSFLKEAKTLEETLRNLEEILRKSTDSRIIS